MLPLIKMRSSAKRRSLISRIVFICTPLLVVILVAVSCSGPQKTAENSTYTLTVNSDSVGTQFGPVQYKMGMAFLSENNYQEALKAFTAAISNGYSEIDVHFARAQAFAGLGLYSGAIGESSICIDMDPNYAAAYELRGISYLNDREYQKTIVDLTHDLALNPSSKEAYYSRGMALRSTGEFDSAVADLKRAIGLDPSYLAAVIWLGRTYYAMDNYTLAIEQFSRAIELDPVASAIAYNDRAVCEGRSGQLSNALTDLNTVAGLYPSFYMVFYNRGVVFMKMNKATPGIVDLDTYLCLDVTNKFGCRWLADDWRGYYPDYYINNGDPELNNQAMGICNGILAQNTPMQDLPFNLGALYFPGERLHSFNVSF
jgi:tetratricopeptide (TPR) repeat protein